MTAAGTQRISLAALVCTRPGGRPRLLYRTRVHHGPVRGRRKGFTETDCIRLLDVAHHQPGGPILLVGDNLSTTAAPPCGH